MNISTDTGWDTRYDFGTAYGDYFRKPFMEAYRAMRKLEAVDYACWNSSAPVESAVGADVFHAADAGGWHALRRAGRRAAG